MSSEAKSLSINGHELYVENHGPQDAPAVILLHHGLGSTHAWKAQIDPLTTAGWCVIAYDRWGYGRSAPRQMLSVPYFDDDMDDLEVLLDNLAIDQAVLVGHSDGGTIGLYFAACRPQRLVCLVTIAAHIYVEPKMEPGIQEVRRSFEQDAQFRRALQRVHGEKADAVFYNWFDGWHQEANRDWDMRPALSQITCNTLVVQGMEDEHATPQHARDIAAGIPGAELWLVDGGRHLLPQELPQVFNSRLLAFLGRASRSAKPSGGEHHV
jgi:pimeloyl-ACP methyl ester carboxylesterase